MTVVLSPGLPGSPFTPSLPGAPGVPCGPAGPGTATGAGATTGGGTLTTVGLSQAAKLNVASMAEIKIAYFMVDPLDVENCDADGSYSSRLKQWGDGCPPRPTISVTTGGAFFSAVSNIATTFLSRHSKSPGRRALCIAALPDAFATDSASLGRVGFAAINQRQQCRQRVYQRQQKGSAKFAAQRAFLD